MIALILTSPSPFAGTVAVMVGTVVPRGAIKEPNAYGLSPTVTFLLTVLVVLLMTETVPWPLLTT